MKTKSEHRLLVGLFIANALVCLVSGAYLLAIAHRGLELLCGYGLLAVGPGMSGPLAYVFWRRLKDVESVAAKSEIDRILEESSAKLPWYAQPEWQLVQDAMLVVPLIVGGLVLLLVRSRFGGWFGIALGVYWLYGAWSSGRKLRAHKAELSREFEELRQRQREYASRSKSSADTE